MTIDDSSSLSLSSNETMALRELMISAVALADRPDAADVLSMLAARAPLQALADAAFAHRLSGTLERSLQRVPEMPTPVLEELRADAEHEAIGGLVHLGALRDIGLAFDHRGISWLTMKGPVVAHLLYTRPSDRQYADLDLLVDRQDFQVAAEVLEEMCFEHVIKDWRLAEEMLAGQIELTAGQTRIDLHWHLHYSTADRYRVSLAPDDMLARARRVELPGQCVPTFDAVDTLQNLAFHAARSDGHRLLWLKDIERSLTVESPDLDELVRRSLRSDCAPQVGLMLRRAAELLDAPVPREVIDALVPAPIRALDSGIRRLSHPVQFHDRLTITRFVTRSIGRSTGTTIAAVPARAARLTTRLMQSPLPNETSDPVEKQRFFDAVAACSR